MSYIQNIVINKEDADIAVRTTGIIDEEGIIRFVHDNELQQKQDIYRFIKF